MRKPAAALLLAFTLLTPGCIGPYNAFNSVSEWNSRATDNAWLNELIFVGLWVVPVYPVAAVADTLIFNSLEFWGSDSAIPKPDEPQKQSELR